MSLIIASLVGYGVTVTALLAWALVRIRRLMASKVALDRLHAAIRESALESISVGYTIASENGGCATPHHVAFVQPPGQVRGRR